MEIGVNLSSIPIFSLLFPGLRFIIYNCKLPISQLQVPWLVTSRIRSRIKYLIVTLKKSSFYSQIWLKNLAPLEKSSTTGTF